MLVLAGLLEAPWALTPWFVFANRAVAMAVIWTTVSAIVRSREASLHLEERTRDLADVNYALEKSAIVAVTDTRGTIKFVNDKFCEISQVFARGAARPGPPDPELRLPSRRSSSAGCGRRSPTATSGAAKSVTAPRTARSTGSTRRSCRSSTRPENRISTWPSATRSPTASAPKSSCTSKRRSPALAKWRRSSRTK